MAYCNPITLLECYTAILMLCDTLKTKYTLDSAKAVTDARILDSKSIVAAGIGCLLYCVLILVVV